MAEIIAGTYGSEHMASVRVGDTLRVLVKAPTSDTWSGNAAIKTSLSASATDDVALSEYTGDDVLGRSWDLYVDYDTSTVPLVAGTRYLIIAELTSGSKNAERVAYVDVLAQGRS